jgi:hypothetical protein
LKQYFDCSKFSADQGNAAAQIHSSFMLFKHRPLNAVFRPSSPTRPSLPADSCGRSSPRCQAMNCATSLPRGSHTNRTVVVAASDAPLPLPFNAQLEWSKVARINFDGEGDGDSRPTHPAPPRPGSGPEWRTVLHRRCDGNRRQTQPSANAIGGLNAGCDRL